MRVQKIQYCARCDSDKLRYKPENGKPHYGRLVCGKCEGFVTWVSQQMAKFLNRFEV